MFVIFILNAVCTTHNFLPFSAAGRVIISPKNASKPFQKGFQVDSSRWISTTGPSLRVGVGVLVLFRFVLKSELESCPVLSIFQ